MVRVPRPYDWTCVHHGSSYPMTPLSFVPHPSPPDLPEVPLLVVVVLGSD